MLSYPVASARINKSQTQIEKGCRPLQRFWPNGGAEDCPETSSSTLLLDNKAKDPTRRPEGREPTGECVSKGHVQKQPLPLYWYSVKVLTRRGLTACFSGLPKAHRSSLPALVKGDRVMRQLTGPKGSSSLNRTEDAEWASPGCKPAGRYCKKILNILQYAVPTSSKAIE